MCEASSKSGRLIHGAALAVLIAFGVPALAAAEKSPTGYDLTAVSGADGVFEKTVLDGMEIIQSAKENDGFSPYIYFRVPDEARKEVDAAYLELTYKDVGSGPLAVEFNGRDPNEDYRRPDTGYDKFLGDGGKVRTAVFRLAKPKFAKRQNMETDLRICSPANDVRLHIVKAVLYLEPTPLFVERDAKPWLGPYKGPTRTDIDAKTLHHKVMCGYQGWFRCPGDPAEEGWIHWSRDRTKIMPESLTFEMWPDMTELGDDEKYPAPGFTYPDGKPASLFSSANAKTVERHFEWMRKYGIDGAFPQRFVVGLGGDPANSDRVLGQVRDSANRTGRVFAVCYDLSGAPKDKVYETLVADWKHLVDEMKITEDGRYLHHKGKPVLFVWGFFSDRFGPALANRIIDFFKNDGKYAVTLIGGCQWQWRGEKDAEWAKVFRRFDVISPWNVGNTMEAEGGKHAATNYWKQDRDAAAKAGMKYLPVIYPGFGWSNLKGKEAAGSAIPRLGGDFYWRQFAVASDLGMDMAYVAMFDEVDEGTAVFKVTNAPPTPGHFTTLDGLPSDWYLRLTGEGSKLIRSGRKNQRTIPIKP
jgi:hypothetical protein